MDEVTTPPARPFQSVHHKKPPVWRSKKIVILLTIIILAFLGWYFLIRDTGVPGADQTKTLTVDGTSFAFPGNWQQLQLSDADKKANVVLKLGSAKPSGSFVWRVLKGKLAKSVDVAALPDQVAAELTSGINGAKIISKGVSRVGSFDAVKVLYTRPDVNDSKITYRNLMYVVPRPNQTHYLTFSAREGDFDKIEPGFAKILNSFVAYTTAHP